MFWIIIALILGGLVAATALKTSRLTPMTNSTRRDWPGRWADLPSGRTRYRWIGGARGPVVVAIHGLTTPSEAWDALAEELTGFGYRVLVYDLYGRGGSDTVAGTQSAEFHIRQLTELLDDQGLGEDLILMGYSMGGQIAAAFAAEAPERVQSLVLIAPAGIETNESRFDRFCREWPVVGDWLHLMFGDRALLSAAADADAAGATYVADAQRRCLKRQGYMGSVLSSRRALVSQSSHDVMRKVSGAGLPLIAIWGRDDTVIPAAAMGTLATLHRRAQHEMIDGAGHGIVYTHAPDIAAHLKTLLHGQS